MNMKVLLCTDLDNTLMHSFKKREESDICVERINDKEQGFMSQKAFCLLQKLMKRLVFVPVTTRSIEQYTRLCLTENEPPPYAVAVHGGVLFKETERDSEWDRFVSERVKRASEELRKAAAHMEADTECDRVRDIDGIYVLTKSKTPDKTGKSLRNQLDGTLAEVTVQGEKVYVIPKAIDKGSAVKRLGERIGADFTVAAGDSVMDIPMLNAADVAIVPNKELAKRLSAAEILVCPETETDFAYFTLKTAEKYIV